MTHREEAPRQELCMKCGRLLPRMHNCFEDSEPSCNGSQQEGQKLTAPDSSETTVTPTPLTDAILPTTHAELIAHAKSLELSLSQCREAQRWIPVSERLPEEYTPVLIAISGVDQPVIAQVHRGYWMDVGACGYDFEQDDVTHWQPLPSAPKE
jgi:hypothetical protein